MTLKTQLERRRFRCDLLLEAPLPGLFQIHFFAIFVERKRERKSFFHDGEMPFFGNPRGFFDKKNSLFGIIIAYCTGGDVFWQRNIWELMDKGADGRAVEPLPTQRTQF